MLSGQRLLDVDGLQERLQGLCQWRIDSVFLRRNAIEAWQTMQKKGWKRCPLPVR